MRELLEARGLRSLRWGTRFSLTLFLLFSLAGYVVMGFLAARRAGFSTASLTAYYVGDEAQMQFGKTTAELLELTHFHLFAMPMLLFVQGHLFLLSFWPKRLKVALVVAAAAGIALDIAAPWLIRDVAVGLAPLHNLGRGLMAIAFVAFALVPLYEMWLRRECREA